jgi:hypothetical protein
MRNDKISLVLSQDCNIVVDQESILKIQLIPSQNETYINITTKDSEILTIATYADQEKAAEELDRYIDATIKGADTEFFVFELDHNTQE